MFVVSVFWSFMADVFRDEEAKRLFGPIAAGGGTGAIVGPLVMQYLAPRIGVDAVVFLAMLLLLGTLPCIRALSHWAEARHGRFVLPPGDPEARIGGGMLSGFCSSRARRTCSGSSRSSRSARSRPAFMYNELLRVVGSEPIRTLRAAHSSSAGSTCRQRRAWVFQGFVVGWLIRRFELRARWCRCPSSRSSRSLALAASPLLLGARRRAGAARGGEYGIAKPSREVLFTVVDAETKYKAKNFIDTVLQRGSDLVGIGLVTLAQPRESASSAMRGSARP